MNEVAAENVNTQVEYNYPATVLKVTTEPEYIYFVHYHEIILDLSV